AGEQWRNGGNATPHVLTFQYQVADAGVITGANAPTTGWTTIDPLSFTGPIVTATAGALDGNAPQNRLAISATLPVTVNNGQEIWVRWEDPDNSGSDHGLAIDDFSVTAFGNVTALVENFDTLVSTGTGVAWTDNSTIPGWYSTRTTYNSGTGSSNAGALYSFG